MSQYQWVIESPENADGVSATILLGFDDSDSDDEGSHGNSHRTNNRRAARVRQGGPRLSSPTPASVTRAQAQRLQDDEQYMWWAAGSGHFNSSATTNNNNANNTANNGSSSSIGLNALSGTTVRTPRSDGGSSRRSKASSNRRSRRGGPGSSGGASSTGTRAGFGQHNGNGRRGSHRGTPIFTSTYFPDNGLEAHDEENHLRLEGTTASPVFTYRNAPAPTQPTQPGSGRTPGTTRTSGSSRSSGGSATFALSSREEEMTEGLCTSHEAYAEEQAACGAMGDEYGGGHSSMVWPERLVIAHVTSGQALAPQASSPSNKKLRKKLSHRPATADVVTTTASRSATERSRRFREASRLVPTTITTVCFADEETSEDSTSSEDDNNLFLHACLEADNEDAHQGRGHRDHDRARPRRGSQGNKLDTREEDPEEAHTAQFAATVASLAAQAHGLRHHLGTVQTPPLAPAKAPEVAALETTTRARRGVMGPPSTARVAATSSPLSGLFSSQRPQPLATDRQAAAGPCVSSFYISPIHQSVAQESSEFSGTPYFFLGEGGGLAGTRRPSASPSSLTRKELREREAALEAAQGFDVSELDSRLCPRSGSGSVTKEDDMYDSSVEEAVRLDTLSTCARWQRTSPAQDDARSAPPSPHNGAFSRSLAQRRADVASGIAPRKRTRRGGGGGYQDDDDHSSRAGDVQVCSTGLRTSSDEDEEEEIVRRVKRRRLQLVGTEECGGSKVLGPLAEPVLLPPDMSLTLPTARSETREDLLKSFFMGQALQEDDFRLY